MHVDTTVEHCRGILANTAVDHGASSRVVLYEVRDVMNNAGDGDQAAAVLGLVLEVIPLHDRKGLQRHPPIEPGALLVKLLLQLLDATFLDLVAAELLQVISKTELLPHPDGPFGRVVLMPLNGVAIVGRELVVEVVVAFTQSDKGGNHVVARGVAVVEGLVTEPMGKRVHAKGGLLNEEDAEDTAVYEATEPITPAETADERGEDETHEEDHFKVVTVLPNHHGIFV